MHKVSGLTSIVKISFVVHALTINIVDFVWTKYKSSAEKKL